MRHRAESAVDRVRHLLSVQGHQQRPSELDTTILSQCSTALLVGASANWLRVRESGYRHVVNDIPLVLYSVRLPRAVHALAENLEEAMKMAVRETIDLITKRFPHLTREEAYMIASVAVDYHVTQVVDGTKGIHGMIPKAIFSAQR